MKRQQGFTLAELLITLGILGVLAAFTIPKILGGSGDSQKYAAFKSTLAHMSQLTARAKMEGYTGATFDYFRDNMNHLKNCPTNPVTQGCWTWADDSGGTAAQAGAIVLHNGVVISSLSTTFVAVGSGDNIIMDWNGAEGPNQIGDDQLYIVINTPYGLANCNPPLTKLYQVHYGSCFGGAWNRYSAANETLYRAIHGH